MLRSIAMIGILGLAVLPCVAQSDAVPDKKPASSQTGEGVPRTFYQLSFVVQEVEAERIVNTRSYSLILRNMDRSSIRAGEKVPFSSSSGVSTQWQQIDVGVRLDCRNLEVSGNKVSLYVIADISSVIESGGANSPPASLPIIRNNQWDSTVLLPLQQPTILFSSDDPASKRSMRLQLTVTPIR